MLQTSRTITLADLLDRLGPMSLSRIRFQPPPGLATEDDVLQIEASEDRRCELVDGILVEKTVGAYESYLAALLIQWLSEFVRRNKLGVVLGEQGAIRLAPGLIRVPDVAYFARESFPDNRFPRDPIPILIPTLAIEVISAGNTVREMETKLRDYFTAGTVEVWYVYPAAREIHVFTHTGEAESVHKAPGRLVGRTILQGFELDLEELFAEPIQD